MKDYYYTSGRVHPPPPPPPQKPIFTRRCWPGLLFPNLTYQSRYLSSVVVKADLGTAPITVSLFTPFVKIMTVGMLRMPYSVAIVGLSSVLSFKHLTLPAYCFAISSIRGAIILQGPHQGAQKSTSTGISLSKTRLGHVDAFTTPATAQKTNVSHQITIHSPPIDQECEGLYQLPTSIEITLYLVYGSESIFRHK